MEIKEGDKVWVSNPYHGMYHNSGTVKRVTEGRYVVEISGKDYEADRADIRNLADPDDDGLPGLY